MKLQELIIYINPDDRSNAQKFWEDHGLANTEININLCDFLQKLSRAVAIEAKDFDQFIIEINRLNENMDLKNIIINMVYDIADNIYNTHEADIQGAVAAIDNALKDSKPIQQYPLQTEKFIGLVNMYHLFSQETPSGQFIHEGLLTWSYPGLNHFEFNSKIPFAINALILTGLLPKTNLNGVNTANPLYNLIFGQQLVEEKPFTQRGIKRINDYFPYKTVTKIVRGDKGNHSFLATNGIKALFIRTSNATSEGVFASKIARCVSSKHFASERLMDNQWVGSRALDSYAISVIDPRIIDALHGYMNHDKKVLPGTGLIEEVCNYVQDGDSNIENLGLSSIDFRDPKTHLSKIDFDGCSISTIYRKPKEEYEENIVSKGQRGLYPHNRLAREDHIYLEEKLYARLKLSMFIKELFEGLADKAFIPTDVDGKRKAIDACVRRSDLVLELFFEHPHAKKFLNDNPRIVLQCFIEIGQYINDHFNEPDAALMRHALLKRVSYISTILSRHLYSEELEPTSLNLAHLSLEMAVTEEVHHYLVENTKPTTAIGFLAITAQIKQLEEKGVIVIWDLIKDKLARRMADAYSPLYTESDPGLMDFIHTGLEIDLGPLPSYQKALSESKGYLHYCSALMRSSFRLFSDMARGEINSRLEQAATQFGFSNQ